MKLLRKTVQPIVCLNFQGLEGTRLTPLQTGSSSKKTVRLLPSVNLRWCHGAKIWPIKEQIKTIIKVCVDDKTLLSPDLLIMTQEGLAFDIYPFKSPNLCVSHNPASIKKYFI